MGARLSAETALFVAALIAPFGFVLVIFLRSRR
jgi:hypothetical protein